MKPGIAIVAGVDAAQTKSICNELQLAGWEVFFWDAGKGFCLNAPDEVAIPKEATLLVCVDDAHATDRLVAACVRAAPDITVIRVTRAARTFPTRRCISFSIQHGAAAEMVSLISEIDDLTPLFRTHLVFWRD